MLSVIMLSAIMLSAIVLSAIMLSAIMLSAIMLSVIVLNAIKLNLIMLTAIILSVIVLGGADIRISGPSYKRTFVYYKHFCLPEHGSDLCIGRCIPIAMEEVRLQKTLSSTLV